VETRIIPILHSSPLLPIPIPKLESYSHSNGIRIPSGNPVPTVISSSELEFSWVHFTGCDPCYRLRQWQIQKIVLEGANGLWGLCPQWGCRGRARTGSVERRSPPEARVFNAFCVMVKAFSRMPKCKKNSALYTTLWVLNYAREIIQASKNVSVRCRWY